MAVDGNNLSSASNGAIRPALLVSADTLNSYFTFLQHFLVGLADESYTSTLICPSDFDVEKLVASVPVEIISHPFFNLKLLWRQNMNKLIERLEKFKPTVLHCLSDSKITLTKKLAQYFDLPYVLMLNSGNKRFLKPSLSSAHCASILAPCSSIATEISQRYPSCSERVKQINFGTFVEDSCACFSDQSHLTSMVVVHQLDNIVDFEPLLGAIRHLAIDGYEFMLVIIGTGRAEIKIRKRINSIGLSQMVNLVPSVHPLRSVFTDADIFIQPQPSKAFNPYVLEAMSVGMVVAGSKGPADDMLIDKQTALVFEAQDEISIYTVLKELCDQKELAKQIALSSQSYLRANYSVNKMVTNIIDTYRDAQQWKKR